MTNLVVQQAGNKKTIDWKGNGIPSFSDLSIPEWQGDDHLINQYLNDGAVLLPRSFQDWVDPLRRGLQKNLDTPDDYAFPCESVPRGKQGRFFDSYCNWLLIPEYLEYILKSCAASMAGQLMRSEVAQFFHEHAFCKDIGTQTSTPWHQDLPYYCVDGRQTVSLYVALDETPADVAVQFVRGSHKWNKLYHPVDFLNGAKFASTGDSMEFAPEVEENGNEFDILAWDLEPGDCIAFNFSTLHGTSANEVKRCRRALSTRWLGDDVVYCARTVETSPPYPDINLKPGERMREDWFPVLWRRQSSLAE